jgi:hypothetical protein
MRMRSLPVTRFATVNNQNFSQRSAERHTCRESGVTASDYNYIKTFIRYHETIVERE